MSSPEDRKKILVVEDEFLIAMDIGTLIEDEGHEAIGPVKSVDSALRKIRDNRIDAAFLDINLGKEQSWPIARVLTAEKIPFVFLSAYSRDDLIDEFRTAPLVRKPVMTQVFVAALHRMLGGAPG